MKHKDRKGLSKATKSGWAETIKKYELGDWIQSKIRELSLEPDPIYHESIGKHYTYVRQIYIHDDAPKNEANVRIFGLNYDTKKERVEKVFGKCGCVCLCAIMYMYVYIYIILVVFHCYILYYAPTTKTTS